MLDRDRAVALAPDDQGRHVAEQVEPVGGADVLAVDVDDRAQGLQERPPRARLLQGPQRPGDRLEVDALRAAAGAQPPPGGVDRVDQPPLGGEAEQRGDTGQRRAAQQRAHLAPEPTAGDQHQPLGALGELVEELHRDTAAERVADDRRPLDADRRQQVADAGRVGAERVVAAGRRRVAVADQVRRDHPVGAGEPLGDRLPVARGVDHAVDQDHGRPAAGDAVDHAVTVQVDLVGLKAGRRVHAETLAPHGVLIRRVPAIVSANRIEPR